MGSYEDKRNLKKVYIGGASGKIHGLTKKM